MSELSYPVLKITPKFIRGGIPSKEKLRIVGERNFDAGCFDNTYLIDSSGYKYRVLSAKRARLTFNPLNIFREYRTIWVDLELSAPGKLNIDQIREEILSILLLHPNWYQNYNETEQSLREKFSEARTVKELVNKISIYP
jgi:hypothetical protein